MSKIWHWLILIIFLIITWAVPWLFPHEISETWSQSPTWKKGLFFGSYYEQNWMVTVFLATQQSYFINFAAITLSLLFGLLLCYLYFYNPTQRYVAYLLRLLPHFPRLLFLLLWCLLFKLHEESQLNWPVSFYLVVGFGLSGGIFLAGQTSLEIAQIKQSLFVYSAESSGLSSFAIFFKHILPNCRGFSLAIVKQLRDNMMLIATLAFIGVAHLKPEDLGTLLGRLYDNPDAFYGKNWWLLFFPSFILILSVIIFLIADYQIRKKNVI